MDVRDINYNIKNFIVVSKDGNQILYEKNNIIFLENLIVKNTIKILANMYMTLELNFNIIRGYYTNFVLCKKQILYSKNSENYKFIINENKQTSFFKNPNYQKTINIKCVKNYIAIVTYNLLYLLLDDKIIDKINIDSKEISFSHCEKYLIYTYKNFINFINLETKNIEKKYSFENQISCLKIEKNVLSYIENKNLKIINLNTNDTESIFLETEEIFSTYFFKKRYLIYSTLIRLNVFDLLNKKIINSPTLYFDFKDGFISDNLFIFYTEKCEKFILDFTNFFSQKAKISFLNQEKIPSDGQDNNVKDFFENVLYDKHLLLLIFDFLQEKKILIIKITI